jgi:2-polyprenyl-6-hydroxyphenyl methylase/3-demethylubiquinone-9 3-methyltransferase
MPVDNQLYDRLAATWWDEDELMAMLRTGMNPARFGYMRRVLSENLGMDVEGKRCLDVGCGGGLLAEEFAKLGVRVTGVDPSEPSLEIARAHAAQEGLQVEYLSARAEELPFEEESFDVVYCCDVLEHVDSDDAAVSEATRVLRAGGAYMYETVNRTRFSRLVLIKLAQDWNATRFMDRGLHDWDMFIAPSELDRTLRRHGLDPRDTVGIAPAAKNPIPAIRDMRRRRRGEITYGEMGRRLNMKESRDHSVSYAGFAVKT